MSCPEIELLLCCARTRIDPTTKEQIKRALQQNVDWIYLLQIASRNGVMPLLYQSLNATHPELIPEPILVQLHDHFHANASRNSFLMRELLKLLHLFEIDHIPAIPFKGPVLATSVYGNLALRQFSDLDILVYKRDISKAKEQLLSRGYRLQMDLGWEYHFVDKDSQIYVDLHQALVPDYFNISLDFESLRSSPAPLGVDGAMVSTILPEDLLLLLSVQLGKDCCHWNVRLIQLCDTAELLRTYPHLDWSRVLERARELGCERILLLNLFLINELFGVFLPREVLERIEADPVSQSLAVQVSSRLWYEPDESPDEPGLWSFFWSYNHRFYWSLRESQRDRLIYCFHWLWIGLRAAFTPNETDRRLLPLPNLFSFLYYPLHLVRVISKYGSTAVSAIVEFFMRRSKVF